MPKTIKKVLISTPPPKTLPKSLQNSTNMLSGVPGVSPEGPESSPRAPRATPERPREVSGAPPERPRSAQRVQQSSGELKTTLWELKKLPPEASGTSFWKLLAHPFGDARSAAHRFFFCRASIDLQSMPQFEEIRGRR